MVIVKIYPQHLNIPLEMAAFAIAEKFARPCQLYVYLKSLSSGMIKINTEEKENIAATLGLRSVKAINNNLKLLLKKNWIGYDKKSKYYFIRSFEKVRALMKFYQRTSAEFCINNIKEFKAFLASTVITNRINQQKWWKRKLEQKHGCSSHGFRKPQFFHPVANNWVAKRLKISLSTAFHLKRKAALSGFIQIQRNFVQIQANSKSPVDAMFKDQVKQAYPEIAHMIRVRRKKLYVQTADTVSSNISFKRRKKIETV